MLQTTMTSQTIDDVLAGTFPASDPPAWTPGMARPAPPIATRPAATGDATNDTRASDAREVPLPPSSARAVGQALLSLTGAAGLVLLLPFAILAVGMPLALGVRGLLEAAEWLIGIIG